MKLVNSANSKIIFLNPFNIITIIIGTLLVDLQEDIEYTYMHL